MKRLNLLFGLVIISFTALAQNEEAIITEAHQSNFRTWSLGLNIGATASLGDAASYFFGDKTDAMPSGVGGFEIGVRGHLTKWFSPTIGVSGTGGFHTISGTDRNYYFEGDYLDGDISLAFNLTNMFLYGKQYQRKHAMIFTVGLGATYLSATGYDEAGNQVSSVGGDALTSARAFTTVIPLKLWYKRQLNETWDLDILYRNTFAMIDGADARQKSVNADFFGYLGVGATYNFGDKEKRNIVYYSPYEGLFADLKDIKENYGKLTNDDDGDGVSNLFDVDSSTPEGINVAANGAPMDSDGDGIPDYMDADPFTAKGAKVDSEGRTIDSDGDGVGDHMDAEPNTPTGALVNFKGISVASVTSSGGGGVGAYMPSVFFSFNSVSVTDANYLRLAAIANALKSNPEVNIILTGHSDASGAEEYNKTLGQRRADGVAKELTQIFGIDASRIETMSSGEAEPLANGKSNINRRVDVAVK
jgi:outer membrane protein OmpA-like peptidoglycan-associated protein